MNFLAKKRDCINTDDILPLSDVIYQTPCECFIWIRYPNTVNISMLFCKSESKLSPWMHYIDGIRSA